MGPLEKTLEESRVIAPAMRNKRMICLIILLWSALPACAQIIESQGAVEMFAFTEGYGAVVPIATARANVSSYGLHVTSEIRTARIPSLLIFEDALLLLGNSRGQEDGKRNLQPMTTLGQFGMGLQIRRSAQLRFTHGENYDIDRPRTTGAPWNSVSLRLERRGEADYFEVHLYPPHNEYDPYPAGPFSQRVVARYGVQFAKKIPMLKSRRIFLFTEPLFLFGNSRPQISYNYSAKPLAVRLVYGAGVTLKRSLQLRFTTGEWHYLGGYRRPTQSWNGLSLRYGWSSRPGMKSAQ
jgi:hypothetical protein